MSGSERGIQTLTSTLYLSQSIFYLVIKKRNGMKYECSFVSSNLIARTISHICDTRGKRCYAINLLSKRQKHHDDAAAAATASHTLCVRFIVCVYEVKE